MQITHCSTHVIIKQKEYAQRNRNIFLVIFSSHRTGVNYTIVFFLLEMEYDYNVYTLTFSEFSETVFKSER